MQFAHSVLRLLVFSVAVFSIIYFCEWRFGGRLNRYRSRNFLHDLFYWFYYLSGLHSLLFTAALFAALAPHLRFLHFHLLDNLPAIPRYVLYLLVTDFIAYWYHRLKHSNRFLWAFHAVHHSQEKLTAFTIARGHPIEQFLGAVVIFVPLQILGATPGAWLPIVFLRLLLEATQHSDLPWKFGPFYWFIVSPKFHAFHHSVSPEHHDCNFGINLSIWDFVFGTSVEQEERPTAYGLPDLRMPTLRSQLLTPLRLAWQARLLAPLGWASLGRLAQPLLGPESRADR